MDWLAFPAAFFAAFLVSWSVNSLALMPWRQAAGLHWTERARRLYPARVGAYSNIFFVPLTLVMTAAMIRPREPAYIIVFGLLGLLGAILATYPGVRETMPPVSFRVWLSRVSTLWLLNLSWLALLVVSGLLMPAQFDWKVGIIGLAVMGLLLGLSFGLAVGLMRCLGLLTAPPDRLQRIVALTEGRMGVAVRRVWLLRSALSYAAAFPATRELIFSERLLDTLSDDEIASVCAHELGHLTEDRTVARRRVLSSLTLFPLVFTKPALALPDQWPGVAFLLLLAWLVILVVFTRRLARKMEIRADTIGAENSIDPATYAHALERIYETNLIPAVMRSNKHAHPHLYDRLLAVGVTPAYDRPAPPAARHWTRWIVPFIFGVVLGIFLMSHTDLLVALQPRQNW